MRSCFKAIVVVACVASVAALGHKKVFVPSAASVFGAALDVVKAPAKVTATLYDRENKVYAGPVVVPAAVAKTLSSLLTADSSYEPTQPRGCKTFYGFGVDFYGADEQRQHVETRICLVCASVRTIIDGHAAVVDVGPIGAALGDAARAAFPREPVLDGIEARRSPAQ